MRQRHLHAPALETKPAVSFTWFSHHHRAITANSCHEPSKNPMGQSPFYRVLRKAQSSPPLLCNFSRWQRACCGGHGCPSCCSHPIINQPVPAKFQVDHRHEQAQPRSSKSGLDQKSHPAELNPTADVHNCEINKWLF